MDIQISLYIKEEDLKIIDKASAKDKRSRSSFMIVASLEKATKE